jgi:arginine decarboxylase
MTTEQILEEIPTEDNLLAIPAENALEKNRTAHVIIGNRIPRSFFWTSGVGESNITIHAGSYHLALKEAGIETFNIMSYSSIMPGIAREVEKPKNPVHGAVLESITAAASTTKGQRATAGIIVGWLYDKKTGERYGGLVCEYHGSFTEEEAKISLRMSLQELYVNGFEEDYDLCDIKIVTKTIIPEKRFGTALVAIGFTDYVYPIIE